MKLIHLAINDPKGFRSLPPGFAVSFLGELDYGEVTDFNPYVLAGGNGSGKSNVLEALAEIFFHLDCRYLNTKPDYFEKSEENPEGYDSEVGLIDAYELEYFIFPDREVFGEEGATNGARVRIIKIVGGSPEITWIDRVDEGQHNPPLDQKECRALLPDHVVGYASGNNETLSTPFFKSRLLQYDAYLSTLENQSFQDPRPETSLVYLDEAYSQAILLTNLLMWGDEETGEHGDQLKPFLETIGLERIDTFRLVIRLDEIANLLSIITPGDGLERLGDIGEIKLLANLDLPEIAGQERVRSYLNKLKLCATCFREYTFFNNDEESLGRFEELIESDNRRYLELDYKVDAATRQAFRFHFEEPVKLFELLHLLLVLNNYRISRANKHKIYNTRGTNELYLAQFYFEPPPVEDRILRIRNFKIRKQGIPYPIDTRGLSDGEHQFLHALGLCLLYKDKRTLFLFDEPETHFNPEWKAKFISAVRSCFKQEKEDASKTMREMLITTHSPLVISDSRREYVRVFKKNAATGRVDSVARPDFETLGASIGRIGIGLFDMPETIGNYALSILDGYLKELETLETKDALTDLFKRVSRDLGESVERELLRHRIITKIEAL